MLRKSKSGSSIHDDLQEIIHAVYYIKMNANYYVTTVINDKILKLCL